MSDLKASGVTKNNLFFSSLKPDHLSPLFGVIGFLPLPGKSAGIAFYPDSSLLLPSALGFRSSGSRHPGTKNALQIGEILSGC